MAGDAPGITWDKWKDMTQEEREHWERFDNTLRNCMRVKARFAPPQNPQERIKETKSE